MPPDTGYLQDRLPYVRAGSGPRPLVLVPGLEDSMFSGTYPPGTGWLFRAYVARFVADRSVYLVSRSRGLSDDATIEDMAADYARVFDSELGPVDLVGISMGGMIGQVLAARRPDLIDRLVLANTGHRIADLAAVERLRRYAREQNWAAIRARLATAMFADWRASAYPLLVRTVGRQIQPRPAEPGDVEISLDAVEAFDSRDWLGDIGPPTLLFGGRRDPYFPPAITKTTAAGVPGAELHLVPGGKHAAYHEFKATFDSTVARFLRRTPPRLPAEGPRRPVPGPHAAYRTAPPDDASSGWATDREPVPGSSN